MAGGDEGLRALEALLRERSPPREVYRGRDGRLYADYGGGEIAQATLDAALAAGLLVTKWEPDTAIWCLAGFRRVPLPPLKPSRKWRTPPDLTPEQRKAIGARLRAGREAKRKG